VGSIMDSIKENLSLEVWFGLICNNWKKRDSIETLKGLIDTIGGLIKRNLIFKGWSWTKLKNRKNKDQYERSVHIQGLKLIKSGVRLKQIESLMRNRGQIV